MLGFPGQDSTWCLGVDVRRRNHMTKRTASETDTAQRRPTHTLRMECQGAMINGGKNKSPQNHRQAEATQSEATRPSGRCASGPKRLRLARSASAQVYRNAKASRFLGHRTCCGPEEIPAHSSARRRPRGDRFSRISSRYARLIEMRRTCKTSRVSRHSLP